MVSIAVDGPAGAGKSTVSRGVAKTLGFIYVDTGALYRTVALGMLRGNVNTDSVADVKEQLKNLKVEIKYVGAEQRVFLNGEDVSDKIRTNEISMLASKVSAYSPVREFLLFLQRDLAKTNNVIMDGRDIGTVVLPDATVKIYLTADAEDRANRRYKELLERGEKADYAEILADVNRRDYNDMHRDIAPLRQAEDALLVDTTGNNLEQSVELMTKIIKEKLGEE